MFAAFDQLLVQSISSTAHVEYLGEEDIAPVAVRHISGYEGHITRGQSCSWIVPNLYFQDSFNNLERAGTRLAVNWCCDISLQSGHRDRGLSEVDILGLSGCDKRLHNLVPISRVEILGPVPIGNEIWCSGGSQ